MRPFRRLIIVLTFFAIAGGVWAAVYAQRKGFYETWRSLIEDEFAKRGVYTKIDKVTLGPLQGLVAEDVFFYQDPERLQEIAFVDNIILDLDLTEVLNRDLSINTLDVKDARLSLPLEPGKKASEMLAVENFSGRLVVTESQIEIVKALANLDGINITLKGSLHRPPIDPNATASRDPEEVEEEERRRLREFGKQLGAIQAVLNDVKRIEFDPFGMPRLEIAFSGELADLGGMRASGRLTAEDFRIQSYTVETLTASMEYDGERRRASLRELHLRDAKGDLRLRADWPVDTREVQFDLDSTADLPALATSLYENPRLGEVVFFDPPRLKLEGTLKLDEVEHTTLTRLPVEAIGEFSSDRIGSRGAIFDGLEFNFSIEGDRGYVRNLQLDHKSGTLLANLMYDEALGPETFRYQCEMKMDPLVFRPFVTTPEARRFLSLWDFARNATIYVAAIGEGPDLNPDHWHSRGLVDLRRLRLNNVRFNRLESSFEFKGTEQVYQDVRLARAEGAMVTPRAIYHADSGQWEVENLKWSVDLIDGVRAFSPDMAKALARHQLVSPPNLRVSGKIDTRDDKTLAGQPREHDFTATFDSDEALEFDFAGETVPLEEPSGSVAVKGETLHLSDFQAGVFGGLLEGDLQLAGGVSEREGQFVIRHADLFAMPPFKSLGALLAEDLPGIRTQLRNSGEMVATISRKGGRWIIENLTASGETARLSGAGHIAIPPKTVALSVRIESLTEDDPETVHYEASGPFSRPEWKRVTKSPAR